MIPDPSKVKDFNEQFAVATTAKRVAEEAQKDADRAQEDANKRKKEAEEEARKAHDLWSSLYDQSASNRPRQDDQPQPSFSQQAVAQEAVERQQQTHPPAELHNTMHVLMIHTLDFIYDLSPKDYKSLIRVHKAQELVQAGVIPRESFMVWTQGYQKKRPTEPPRIGAQSLGKSYADYCKKVPEFSNMRVLQQDLGWGTLDDIKNACSMVQGFLEGAGAEEGYQRVMFHFVTDPTHMKRAKLVWNKVRKIGWEAEFHRTDQEVLTKREIRYLEPLKRMMYRILLLKNHSVS